MGLLVLLVVFVFFLCLALLKVLLGIIVFIFSRLLEGKSRLMGEKTGGCRFVL